MAEGLAPSLTLTSTINMREEYNDNILLISSDEEDDFITTINPAIALTYNTKLMDVALDYGLDYKFYAKHPELSNAEIMEAQKAKFESVLRPTQEIFLINVSDEYARALIDERQPAVNENIIVNTTQTNALSVNPYTQYSLTKTLLVRIDYIYKNIWYKDEKGDDAQAHTASIILNKTFSSRISAGLFYSNMFYRPEKTREYNSQSAGLTLDYQISRRLLFNAEALGARLDIKDNDESLDSPGGSAQAEYLLTSLVSIGLSYSDDFKDSVSNGLFRSQVGALNITYKGRITTKIIISNTDNNYTDTDTDADADRRDISNGITIDSVFAFTPKITGKLTGSYTSLEFLPEPVQEVKRYIIRPSLAYTLRKIEMSLGYTYNRNNSTKEVESLIDNNYINNIIWLQAEFTL